MIEGFQDVLRAACSGEDWAYRSMYRDLNPRLLRYFASYAPGAAEDLASETWIGVARGLKGFSGDEPAWRAWVFKIGHRRLLDYWTRTNRDRSVSTDPAELPDRRAPDDTEGQFAVNDSVMRALRLFRDNLTGDQANVLILRILGGLSADQVGGILGKTPNTVRVVQHTALKKLAGIDYDIGQLTP